MKARSLSCACLFTASTLLLAAPALAIKPAGPNAQPAITAAVQAAVDGKGRTPDNVKRDAYRHPAQTLSFFGVEPGKSVIEITPGSGWYSEILAPLLHDNGHYIAAVVDPMAVPEGRARDYQARGKEGLEKKFAANPALYGKARVVAFDPAAPQFGADGSVDTVLTFRNVHNWRTADQAEGMFKGFYRVLKPGGVLGVVEHRAKTDVPADDKSGYVGQAQVIAMAEAAGFKLAGSSEINANPRDTKDYPGGVWTLPPSNNHDKADDAKYKAIGESDRMTLRFVK
ncbi:MAG: class I SAM-dependent methyltransferase [Stenotrophomonas sp.]|uniref:class I SAM-dependent methyltransferase n=1 Tax=Stenotrophomonas sp. TaxID=69392 RepID=UPI003D6CA507